MAEPLDVVCLGRAAVDLYGLQVGGRLEDVQSFARYLGGSSANLAAGLARLGLRAAMLTRVGDEPLGRFVREQLAREGVDVSQVRTDPDRLTGLVVLGIGADGETPHVFLRERCADMGLCEADVEPAFIARARVLALTGTHLSTPATRAAVLKAVGAARAAGVRVVLDIDYRPVLWGLAAAGEGASRFVASARVTEALAALLPACDLVVGTEEEIAIAGGSTDTLEALRAVRAGSAAMLVLKRGPAGCVIFGPGPITPAGGTVVPGLPVEVFNTLGAGDAFLAGFLSGWVRGAEPAACARIGNACGALVVARHGCTPAMPGAVELAHFLERTPPPRQPRRDEALVHLHRASTWRDDPRPLCILAFDHRRQLEQLAAEHGQPFARIERFKALVADAVDAVAASDPADVRHGIIVDERYGAAVLARAAAGGLWTGRPAEIPGSRPLELDPRNDFGLELQAWPVRHVVKCLLFYHPDDPLPLRLVQEERIRSLYADIVALDRRMVLEIICPDDGPPVDASTVARSLRRLYNLGVRPDWWKLEPQDDAGWAAISAVIAECDPHCKGVLLLGLDADEASLERGFEVAARYPLCRGFAVGRSIFGQPAREWFAGTLDDAGAREAVAARYARMNRLWRRAAAGAGR